MWAARESPREKRKGKKKMVQPRASTSIVCLLIAIVHLCSCMRYDNYNECKFPSLALLYSSRMCVRKVSFSNLTFRACSLLFPRRCPREREVLSSFKQEALARFTQWYGDDRHVASHIRSLDREARSYVHVQLQDREKRGPLCGYPQNVFSTRRRSVFGLCTGELTDDEPG